MATLIVDLHCMCLFVPDKDTNSVHVLMPAMHGPGHAHHTGAGQVPEKHVARMLHRSFLGQQQGISMEGWSLVLDGPGASLQLNPSPLLGAGLPDLTDITGKVVPGTLVSSPDPAVISRVTFRGGAAIERYSDTFRWDIGGSTNRFLANRVTWVIPNVPDQLQWTSLGATGNPPIAALSQLDPEAGDLYRISIHHETERTLPGGPGPLLDDTEMRQHFAAFYGLLGITPLPDEADPQYKRWFPKRRGGRGGGGGVMCRSAMARLTV